MKIKVQFEGEVWNNRAPEEVEIHSIKSLATGEVFYVSSARVITPFEEIKAPRPQGLVAAIGANPRRVSIEF